MRNHAEDTLIVRDSLARQRTKLANDRTLLFYKGQAYTLP